MFISITEVSPTVEFALLEISNVPLQECKINILLFESSNSCLRTTPVTFSFVAVFICVTILFATKLPLALKSFGTVDTLG